LEAHGIDNYATPKKKRPSNQSPENIKEKPTHHGLELTE
jgi:hypothetical protein